jgi:hypothetical protein
MLIQAIYFNNIFCDQMSNVKLFEDVTNEMTDYKFWISNMINPDEIVLSSEDILKFNKNILNDNETLVRDLRDYPEKIDLNFFLDRYVNLKLDNDLYFLDNNKVSDEYIKNIEKNIVVPGNSENIIKLKYGICARSGDLRTLPESEILKSNNLKNNVVHDFFQESRILVGEPLIVLCESKDKNWYLVESSYGYRAWTLSYNVAIYKKKDDWLKNFENEKILIVTGNKSRTKYDLYNLEISELELSMGTKLRLSNNSSFYSHNVIIPTRDNNGFCLEKNADISINKDTSIGYLKLTRRNILNLAFKQLGEKYGWGGMQNSEDCSSYVKNIFRCFGLILPSNTRTQRCIKNCLIIKDLSLEKRKNVLDLTMPGSIILFDGHVGIYLGNYKKKNYLIHDFGRPDVMCVCVSSFDVKCSNGKTLIEILDRILKF